MKRIALILALIMVFSLTGCMQTANGDSGRKMSAKELTSEIRAFSETIQEWRDANGASGPTTRLNMSRAVLEFEPQIQSLIEAYDSLSPKEREKMTNRGPLLEWQSQLEYMKYCMQFVGTWYSDNDAHDRYVFHEDGTYEYNERDPWIWGIVENPVTRDQELCLDGWKNFKIQEENGTTRLYCDFDQETLTKDSDSAVSAVSAVSAPADTASLDSASVIEDLQNSVAAVAAAEPEAAPATHFCPSCGQPVGEGMAFCPYCGKPLNAQNDAAPVATVSGTAGSGNLVHSFGNGEGIVVLEDAFITVRLMSFYEKEYSWSSGKTVEKCVEFKVRNNSSNEYILNFEKAYIGEDGVRVLMSDGNTGPVPGKSNTYNYTIQKESGSNGKPLDSLDDLYSLEGVFALSIYNADKSAITDRHEASLKLQDVFSGSAPAPAAAPVPAPAPAPAAASAADVDAALQGTWVLQGTNYFSFSQGSISISGGGSNLNGTYTINTADSTVDATLSASNGNVTIHLPYTFVNGTLTLRNNQNVELVKN